MLEIIEAYAVVYYQPDLQERFSIEKNLQVTNVYLFNYNICFLFIGMILYISAYGASFVPAQPIHK